MDRFPVFALLLALGAGCRSVPVESHVTKSHAPAEMAGNVPTCRSVSNVLALWSHAVLRQDDLPVAQGFTCKVYLVDAASGEPATADGVFKVFAFEETSLLGAKRPSSNAPDLQWEFASNDPRAKRSKDPLGWGYSFWLPCGPPQKADRHFSLIVRFTPSQGQPVVSESTLVHLPSLTGSTMRGVSFRYNQSPMSPSLDPASGAVAALGSITTLGDDE